MLEEGDILYDSSDEGVDAAEAILMLGSDYPIKRVCSLKKAQQYDDESMHRLDSSNGSQTDTSVDGESSYSSSDSEYDPISPRRRVDQASSETSSVYNMKINSKKRRRCSSYRETLHDEELKSLYLPRMYIAQPISEAVVPNFVREFPSNGPKGIVIYPSNNVKAYRFAVWKRSVWLLASKVSFPPTTSDIINVSSLAEKLLPCGMSLWLTRLFMETHPQYRNIGLLAGFNMLNENDIL